MKQETSIVIAAKMEEAMTKLEEAVEYMHENLEPGERGPLIRAIGEVFGIVTDKIKSRLVAANPELHEPLFRGLPKDAPANFLEMSQMGETGKPRDE